MRKLSLLLTVAAGLALFTLATAGSAAERGRDKEKGKEVTITGDAKCAKCALQESEKCQTVIQTENKQGKTVTYYLADNEIAKGFHKNVCNDTRKVTATGTVKKVKGKQQLTVTKIDLAK
ncbi:MAG TPA: DUF6370 family protein [Verrucomicrobiae bacterium]